MAPDINESKSLFDSFGTLDEIDDSENYFEEKKPPTLPPLWLYPFYGFSGSEFDCQTKKLSSLIYQNYTSMWQSNRSLPLEIATIISKCRKMLLEIILYGLLCGSLSILAEKTDCQLPEWQRKKVSSGIPYGMNTMILW